MSAALFDNRQWDFAQRRYVRENDVLRHIVLEEIKEKINDHDRRFKKVAVIGKNASIWVSELPFQAMGVEVADRLEFAHNDYDLILHLGALTRMNDPVGQMVQSRLALRPDGVFMAAFLGGESLQELRHAFYVAEEEIYQAVSPHVAPMIEIKDAGNLLARAGLALPVADNIKHEMRYSSLQALLHDIRALGLTNPMRTRRKNFTRRSVFDALERVYNENFSCGEGRIYASFELIFLTGYAPSSNQPKALRPGSITQSFGAFSEN